MLPSRARNIRQPAYGQRAAGLPAFRPSASSLRLPFFAPDVPALLQEPSGGGREVEKGTAEFLVRQGALASFDTDCSLSVNVTAALEAWSQRAGHFDGLHFLGYRLTVREAGLDWETADGRCTPYIAFGLEPKSDIPHVVIGPGLRRLHAVDHALPAAVCELIGRVGYGVQLYDFEWFLSGCEGLFWQGESDHATVLKMLRSEIGKGFNPEEHLLPKDFFSDFPRWVFPRLAKHRAASEQEILRRFVGSPPSDLAKVATALDAYATTVGGPVDELRTPFWRDFCEQGCELLPLAILRMDRADCAARIIDEHEENQRNSEGFLDLCGGYAAGAGDPASMDAAWEQTTRMLAMLNRLDALLEALAGIS